MRFLFLGFWSQPTYSIPKNHPDYKIYWDGHLTDDELQDARFVKQHYGYTIKPEQICWWRREAEFKAEEYMWRHYPWHERQCFIASGSGFFPAQKTLEIGEALAQGPPYQAYTYKFTDHFLDSEIVQTRDGDTAMLRVWEQPEPGGCYAIGCDPSGGGGGESDDHAIQVLRCYSDKVVQVAEFQTNHPLTYQLAWALVHLCGAYADHWCNLEITGVGAAVMPEVRNLRQLADQGLMNAVPGLNDPIKAMIGRIRWFLYSRIDTYGNAGSVLNWKTNQDNKAMIYASLKDALMQNKIEIRSLRLVRQLQAIVEEPGGWIGAGADTGENDDLVSAFVLAHWAYIRYWRDPLTARNMTWESVKGDRPPQTISDLQSHIFQDFFVKLNQRRREHREKF
jgi:hypothetical protein